MPRILDPELEASLQHCTTHTTLYLELASGAEFHFATAHIPDVGGETYLGELTVKDSLRMSLTKAADNINFELQNVDLVKGQLFIAEEKALIGAFAVVGCYFENYKTGAKWHVEKVAGEIVASEINGDAILFDFISDLDSAVYYGTTYASIFPDRIIPIETAPVEAVISPVSPIGGGGGGDFGNQSGIFAPIGRGRYRLPPDLDLPIAAIERGLTN